MLSFKGPRKDSTRPDARVLEKEKILDPLQTGFKKHHSTETALLKLTEDIRRGIDKKYVTLLLLFDFSKAFDTISSFRLLGRLRLMGFSRTALQWISSYISGRQQCVCTQFQGSSSWLNACHKDQFWDPCCFVYTLMTYVTYLTGDALSTYYMQMTYKFKFKCQKKV